MLLQLSLQILLVELNSNLKKNYTRPYTSHNVTKTVKIGRKSNLHFNFEGIFYTRNFLQRLTCLHWYKTHNPPYIDVKAVFEDRAKKLQRNNALYEIIFPIKAFTQSR